MGMGTSALLFNVSSDPRRCFLARTFPRSCRSVTQSFVIDVTLVTFPMSQSVHLRPYSSTILDTGHDDDEGKRRYPTFLVLFRKQPVRRACNTQTPL
jgi:hypothetical protein